VVGCRDSGWVDHRARGAGDVARDQVFQALAHAAAARLGVGAGLLLAAGAGLIWMRSELVGAAPIERPGSMVIAGKVLERIEQPADDRIRLVLATREQTGRAIKVRVNVPVEQDSPALREGAIVRLKARLMPPAPPNASWRLRFRPGGVVRGLCGHG